MTGGDPTGTVRGRAWMHYTDGDAKIGHPVDVQPPSSEPPSDGGAPTDRLGQFGPFADAIIDALLPVSPNPAAWYVPPVEPPTVDAGPHLPDLVPLPAWGIYVDESNIGTTAAACL